MSKPDQSKRKLRILIAEDNVAMREYLYKMLKEDFEIVKAVGNGRELVSTALEMMPDVIVSDTSMPLLGGLSAVSELSATGTNLPVVLISSVFRWAGVARHAGAIAYVDKSDLSADLGAAVRAAAAGQFFLSRSIQKSTS
jgi:DNA-binding NarL/FixJ family response regulator